MPTGRVWGLLGIDTDISELKHVEAELRQIKTELESRVEERTAALADANCQLTIEIAERSRAEAALHVSQERYRLISELTSDYAYALSCTGDGVWQIEWCSDAFTRITDGMTPRLDRTGGWEGLLHPEDAAIMEQRWQRLRSGRSVTTDYRIITKDGRHRWLRDRARPLQNETKEGVSRILGAARDITDRKQAEEEIRRHQDALAHVSRLSMMGELTGQLAHELNQPLCTVVGNAQTARRLLKLPMPDMVELQECTRRHRRRRQTRRRGDPPLAEPGPPTGVAANGTESGSTHRRGGRLCRDGCSTPRSSGAVRHRGDLPAVRGDSIQLQQVILNLVRNGLEAMVGTDSAGCAS